MISAAQRLLWSLTSQGGQISVIEPLSTRGREAAVPGLDGEVHVTWPASVSLCFNERED